MSGTSTFARRSSWAKSDSKTPVSTPSNSGVCKYESLTRRQDKTLSTQESALANSFLFISFLSKPFWYVEFCSAWYFGNSCFVTARVFKLFLLLYTETGREHTAPSKDKWLMTVGVITFMRYNPFSDAKTSLLCFQGILFRKTTELLFQILSSGVSLCFASFLWEDLLNIRRGTW